ncbi:MAG: sugar phosphate isomerase/epimerase [Clostridia bacterium]|nr:sugar phosphate isomerase/epimerase [Clostridia bacterium]
MNLATTTEDFSFYTNDQTKIIKCIKKSGFTYADYSFGVDYKNRSGIYASDWKKYVKELQEHCKTIGVTLIQAHSPMGTPLADNNEEFINATKRCIEACGVLGIKNIVVHSGYLKGISKKETLEKNKLFYENLLGTAEKYEVNILTENFNKMCIEDMYWIDNATDLLELIECVNHPLFHAVWDTGHANMQEMSQEEELTRLGKHVKALHIHDNNGEKDQHMCPFFGTLNVDSLVKGLKKIGYDGYFTFEASNFFEPATISNSDFEPDLDLKLEAEKLLCKIGEKILERYSL